VAANSVEEITVTSEISQEDNHNSSDIFGIIKGNESANSSSDADNRNFTFIPVFYPFGRPDNGADVEESKSTMKYDIQTTLQDNKPRLPINSENVTAGIVHGERQTSTQTTTTAYTTTKQQTSLKFTNSSQSSTVKYTAEATTRLPNTRLAATGEVSNATKTVVTRSKLTSTTSVNNIKEHIRTDVYKQSNETTGTNSSRLISPSPTTSLSVSVPSVTQTTENTTKNIDTEQTISSNTVENSTEESFNSTIDPNRLSFAFLDTDFRSRDSFWPIAMALTIGIPTIIVFAVTITVLYRGRLAKPRSLLSMYGQDYNQM
jgi:hypothetical protein